MSVTWLVLLIVASVLLLAGIVVAPVFFILFLVKGKSDAVFLQIGKCPSKRLCRNAVMRRTT